VNTQHIAYWLGTNEVYTCGNNSDCWAQIGIARGYFTDFSPANPAVNMPYFEAVSPLNGSVAITSNQGLNSNTFFTSYYNGLTYVSSGRTYYEFTGVYGSPSGPYYFPNISFLPYDNGFPEAYTEFRSDTNTTCPSSSDAYFGTDGSGHVTSGTWLDYAQGTGYPNNWVQSNYPAQDPTDPPYLPQPYHVIFYNGGYPGDAFYTYGS
jgi:hypothetical protein